MRSRLFTNSDVKNYSKKVIYNGSALKKYAKFKITFLVDYISILTNSMYSYKNLRNTPNSTDTTVLTMRSNRAYYSRSNPFHKII